MNVYRLTVKLVLEGPISTSATNPGALGVDAPFARKWDDKLYFPGTLVKGKLRQAWTELAGWSDALPAPEECEAWLGRKAGDARAAGKARTDEERRKSFDPSRGRAYFSDFTDQGSSGKIALRTRIQ